LPAIGDYLDKFSLLSPYIVTDNDPIAGRVTYESLHSYLKSVSICLDRQSQVMSTMEIVPRQDTIDGKTMGSQATIGLDLLNMPVMPKYGNSLYLIVVKFKRPPPVQYHVCYDIGLTGESGYMTQLSKELIVMDYKGKNGAGLPRSVQITFKNGQVSAQF